MSDIVASTGLAQSTVSTHLGCLWDCGLVARERRGREKLYRLTDGVADEIADTGAAGRACVVLRRALRADADAVPAFAAYGRVTDDSERR